MPAVGAYGGGVQRAGAARLVTAKRKSDPKKVLAGMEKPATVEEWEAVQSKVWANHDPLPRGWIRIWSGSHNCEYYMNLDDDRSTFEIDEVF